MKKLFTLLALVLAAALTAAQDAKPTGKERQFVGDVVSADVAGKTLTLKVAGVQPEKTLTMAVDDGIVADLGTLKSGETVTVLWVQDQEKRRNVVVAIAKREPAPDEKP